MQLFYAPQIEMGYCTLDAEESRHAVRVMRMRQGDTLHITDGHGHLYHCTLVDPNDRACTIQVEELLPQPTPSYSIRIGVAPTKNPARMEWLVEKAVEMGVSEIALLQCDHSERTFLKTDRLQKLSISAMKQSLHTTLPNIQPPQAFNQWIAQLPSGGQRYIAHCDPSSPRSSLLDKLHPGGTTTILIGPEGDFSPTEIETALQAGFEPVSFGTARMRTETAALFAIAAINFINS